jgi:translation initiation factor RLI1
MPAKMASLAFSQCHPEKCDGTCLAAAACPHKLIKQESPGSMPMFHPSTCRGCGDCARVCPLKAIRVVRM